MVEPMGLVLAFEENRRKTAKSQDLLPVSELCILTLETLWGPRFGPILATGRNNFGFVALLAVHNRSPTPEKRTGSARCSR